MCICSRADTVCLSLVLSRAVLELQTKRSSVAAFGDGSCFPTSVKYCDRRSGATVAIDMWYLLFDTLESELRVFAWARAFLFCGSTVLVLLFFRGAVSWQRSSQTVPFLRQHFLLSCGRVAVPHFSRFGVL